MIVALLARRNHAAEARVLGLTDSRRGYPRSPKRIRPEQADGESRISMFRVVNGMAGLRGGRRNGG